MRPATCSTKSHSPPSTTPSMMLPASTSIRGCIDFTAFGMKAGTTSRRYRPWSGGSIVIIMRGDPAPPSPTSVPSGIRIPWAEENVAGSRPIAFTSSYRVTAQKPGPPGSSCRCTGSCSRSHRKTSCGCPPSKASGSSRSMTGAVVMDMF